MTETPNPMRHFYMCTLMVLFVKEEQQKQRHMNILLEMESPNITRKDLTSISQNAMARLNTESGIAPDQVKDVIVLAANHLGYMTPAEFHGEVAPSA